MDSFAGVSFRHLSMLAQIKSSDKDVWGSLERSGHIEGEPSIQLRERLARMRSWIDGPHFPDESKVEIRVELPIDEKKDLDSKSVNFLSELSARLSKCDWDEDSIVKSIKDSCESSEIPTRDGFKLLYWVLIGKNDGPKASSLIYEIGRTKLLRLLK